MGRIKQKLLILILSMIAVIVGYQAYVIGHGYARTASNVPFSSGGVMIYCREHHNSFNYSDGTRGYAYACCGEVNLSTKNAHDFAYYISRGGSGIQGRLWAHSGSSQGAIILNEGSSYSNWFGGYSGAMFDEGVSGTAGSVESVLQKQNESLASMLSDLTSKPVEEMPEYFFENINANRNDTETTPSEVTESDKDIKSDFVEQIYNDFCEKNSSVKQAWGKNYKEFNEKIKKEAENKKINWAELDSEKKDELMEMFLESSGCKTNNIKKIEAALTAENLSEELKKGRETLKGITFTDLDDTTYDKERKEATKKQVENVIKSIVKDVDDTKAKSIVNEIIKVEQAEQVIEETIFVLQTQAINESDKKQEAELNKEISNIEKLLKTDVHEDEALNESKQALKEAQSKLEDEKIDYDYDDYYNDIAENVQEALRDLHSDKNDDEISFLADEIAAKVVEDAIEKENKSGLITDISFEEYKYLFELYKLYQDLNNKANNGSNEIINYKNGNLTNEIVHLNKYWSDGRGTILRTDASIKEAITSNDVSKVKNATISDIQGNIQGNPEKKTNAEGYEVEIYKTTINKSQNATTGAPIWKFSNSNDELNKGDSVLYYEDDPNADVTMFDRLVCFDNQGGTTIGIGETKEADEKILQMYVNKFQENDWQGLCDEIKKHYPNLAKKMRNADGNTMYDKVGKVRNEYKNRIRAICGNSEDKIYNIYDSGSDVESLDYRFSGSIEKAATIFQYLMQPNAEGITNMESIANRFKVDDSDAKVSIDAEKGKYIIGPYRMNYASITLNNEQILGINGFSVNLLIKGKDGKITNKTLTEGYDKSQYQIVQTGVPKRISVGGKVINIPRSGSTFYIELDKDVKGDGTRLTADDQFSFNVSYKYLARINAIIHFLRDCTGPNDAAHAFGGANTWDASHPQRLVALTYGDEWKYMSKSTPINTSSYDFKLRKVRTQTEEEKQEQKRKEAINGAEFAAAAKYKSGNETVYFDLETRTKNLGSDFNSVVEKTKNGEATTYISKSQPEGDGYIVWNNIEDSIVSGGKTYTLECVEAKEIKAPKGYKITQDKNITISKEGNGYAEAENNAIAIPYTLKVRKVDEKGNPIKNLEIEGWFLDLGVENALWKSVEWDYGPKNHQFVKTDENGIAEFTNNMYGGPIIFIMKEKPANDYEYQYFKRVAIIYSAENKDGKAEIKFLSKNDNVQFKYEWLIFNSKTEYQDGVFLIDDKNGTQYIGNSEEAKKLVKTREKITDKNANVDIQITNESKKTYSLVINKLDEFGDVSTYLKGTKFKVWISKDGKNYVDGREVVIGEDGKGTLDQLAVYGDNLALYIQEVETKTGFKTRFKDKTIVLLYKADENGTLTIRENSPENRLFGNLPEGKKPIEIKQGSGEEGDSAEINMSMTNESDNYYLKFRKIDKDGKPLKDATFTLTDKDPRSEDNSEAHSQTVSSDDSGYMEFVGPEETKEGDVTLYLYEVSAPGGYKSDADINNPIEIKYKYKAGYTELQNLQVIYNGEDLNKNNKLQCEREQKVAENGETVEIAKLKDNKQYVFNFGELNEVFKLINYEVTYDLEWQKEDTKGNPLSDTEFKVSVIQFDKKEAGDQNPTVEDIIKSLEGNSDLPKSLTYAEYEKTPIQYDANHKKTKDPEYAEIKGMTVSTKHDEGDGYNNGTAVIKDIATYGDCYVIMQETKTDGKHQKIDDVIIAHYKINPGDTEPTWQSDLKVAKKGEDGKYTVTDYTKKEAATAYTDKDGKTYQPVKYSESNLIVENEDLPYTLKLNKVNGLSGKPVSGVSFSAEIYHKGKNDEHKTANGKTTSNGELIIDNIYKYSEDDSDIITVELHETVPEGYRYHNKYYKNEIVYVADYVKTGPEQTLSQKNGYIIGYLADGAGNPVKGEDGTHAFEILSSGEKAFTISENLDNTTNTGNNAENNQQFYVHTVTIQNMPTYNLGGLMKVEKKNNQWTPVTGVSFTGEIRKGGVGSTDGKIIQEGQAYTPDGTKLELSKFTIKVEDNGSIIAYGIDTTDEFVNTNGKYKDGEQTFTLVLTEQESGRYIPLEHDIEIEYTCKYDTTNDKWETKYTKVKYGDKQAEVKVQNSEAQNLTGLLDTDELGLYQKGTDIYVVNKPDFNPAQILLQKKDEEGNLINGITFKGKVEQVNPIEGEKADAVNFEVTTGESKDANGNILQGVALIDNINLSREIKITIESEAWKDKNNKQPLEFPTEPIVITGIEVYDDWEGNIGYKKIRTKDDSGKITVQIGEQEAQTIDVNNKDEASENLVSFTGNDSNVVTFYITNKNKTYDLDGKDADTGIPFPYKVERDILGNEKNVTEGITFTGRIEDSNGEILQDPVTVQFKQNVNSSADGANGEVGIEAKDINGKISVKEGEQEEEYKLIIKENNVSSNNTDAVTVIYTCKYNSDEDEFTSKIKAYEYNGKRYDFNKNMEEVKKDLIPGEVKDDGARININDLYVPIRKFDEYGNLINGVVFKGKIKVNIEKDENGHPKDFNLKEEYDFITVTGGQYWNDETKQMETAPDGVAVIPIPSEVKGDFTITIDEEYWGTYKENKWTTEKGKLPDGQFPLEFVKGVVEIGGYGIKEETKNDITERTVTYNGTTVKYTLNGSEENSEPIEVENYKAVTTDEKGYIRFINNELRYDLKKSTETGEGNNLFDDKFLETSYGYRTKIKEGIYFTGYIVDETKYDEKGNIIKPSVTLQEGRSTKDPEDKNKVTVALDKDTGAIVATGIKGSIAGIDENKTFKFVLEELSSNGENGTLNVVPIDPIVVEYTCKYDRENEKFETAITAYEYKGKKYRMSDIQEQTTVEKDIIPGLVCVKEEESSITDKIGLINHEKTIDIPLVKKDEAGRLVNGIKFTGKIIALDEEYKDENGKPVFETTEETNNNEQPTTKRKSMNFEVVTGEVPTKDSIKLDGSKNEANNSEDKNFTDEDGKPMYTARDGVALIPQIPYTGKVKIIIEKEEWADEDYKPAPGDPDLEFIDGQIEVTFSIVKDKNGEKHINYNGGMQIEVKDRNGQNITNDYMDPKNNQHKIIVGPNYLGKDEKDFAFGISVTNKFKSYDVPIALKVIEEDTNAENEENNENKNIVTVNNKKYRQPTKEEAKEIKFRAEVTDSSGTVVQTLLPLTPDDMAKADAVGIGIEVKDIDSDGKEEAVIIAKGIKGSINKGEDLIIKLQEVYSGGLEPIPDIKVHYKIENGEAKITKYECNGQTDECKQQNNGTCKIKDLIYVSEDGKYALVNKPETGEGPKETTPILTIKKVMNVDGHEVGVPGIYFKIRVCTEECKNDCKDPDKCSCQEGEEPCEKCFDYTAISQAYGLTTFKLTDFAKNKEDITTGKVKVIILEERLATEEDKAKIKENSEETSEDEKTAEVAPYTTEQPGEVKLEFIKNPIVINGIEIKNGEEENGDKQCKVDYTNATVADTNSNVSFDNQVGMQIVFTNKEATFDLDLFKGKMINYIGELEQIYKGVEFEADVVRAEDIKAENIAEVSLQHIVSTTDESTAENTGDNGNLATTGIETNNGKIQIKGIKGTFASESNEEQQENAQQYAVVLRETASEISDAKDMPTMAIVFESKCTTGTDGKCTFTPTIKEYKWQDDNGWHTLNALQNLERDENGNLEQVLVTNRMLRKIENGKEETYIVNTPPTTIIGGGYLPTTVDIPLVKYDENGNLVNGVKFSGHIEVGNQQKMKFSTITGEVPTTTIANGFENVYVARDGVAIIPKIPFTGEVKVVIEKEEWASDAYKPSAGYPDLEFIDGKIEITLTINEDEKGNKHIQQGGISIAVKGKDDKDITDQYIDRKNGNNKVLVGLNSLNKDDNEDNEELLFGIKITNKIKTYDLPIALKVIAEDNENANGANTIKVGDKTYRTPSTEEAKELRFSAEVLDSTGTVVQNLLPLTPEQMQNADAVGIGIATKGSDNKTEAVITAKGIKGSIVGDNLTIRLHEENSAGLEPIPDIDVHYKTIGDDAPKVTSYQCGEKTVENSAPTNGEQCNIEDLIYVSEDGKYALVNKPGTGGGPKETTPELTIKKVINVDGHEVGVPGVHFKIRVCTPECKNDCTDVAKCGCENNNDCDKCYDYEAVSKAGGLATFELTDFSKDTTAQNIDNLKVIILEEKLATEEEKAQLAKEGVEPYTTENPGDVKLEFIKNPITINGIQLKNATEGKKTQCTVDYTNATVADENSNVRIDSKAGMQIVFTNTEATYNFDLFDSKLVYEDNKLKQIYKGVEFEADIVRVEDINAENIAEKSLQHFVSETAKATSNNTGKNGDLGTVGLDANDGKIKLKGVKGTLAGDNGQKYAVMLKETSSEVSDADDMPTMVIVYKCTCTTDGNGKCQFKPEIEEYKWQDDEGWHSLNPTQNIQTGENGQIEKNEIIVDGRVKIQVLDDNNKVVSLINDGGKIELSTSESIKLTKKDSNGNTVGGIEFKGKVIALNADGTPKKEAMSDEQGNIIQGTKNIEYEFDVITDNKGTALIYTPDAKEMPKYEGKIKVVIEDEKWAASVTEPPYKLGFADEIIEITGLELKTETTGQLKNGKIVHTRVVYPEQLTVTSYKKGENGTKTEATNTYKDKVSLGKDSVIGIEIENSILDYDVDLFDAKILKYGEHYEQLNSDVTFSGRIIGYKGKDSKQEAKDYDVEVKLIEENDTTSGQQGTANGKKGKIVAKGINGEITGSGIYLELIEKSINYDVEDVTVIIKYDYTPDAQGKGTPVIKEYRKWKDGVKGEAKGNVSDNTTDLICNAEGDDNAKALIGEMIYKNYSDTAKNSLVNIVTPNPLDLQIKKVDSNGKPVAGIKFTGRIIAVDDKGEARKEKDAQGKEVEIKKEFTTSIANSEEPLQWITSDSDGVASLHLTSEEVNKFAGKIKIEIDSEEWSTDEKDPLRVDSSKRTPLDFIDGKIEITGKKIDVQKDKTSSIINAENNGTPTVKIMKDKEDVTEKYKDRVNANSNEIALSMKNIIKEYDLKLFNKKIINVNGEEIQIKGAITFTGEIKQNDQTYPITIAFGPETDGAIIAKGIRGEIVGDNIKLSVKEAKTIPGIVPVDFDIVYSCTYNDGKFETTISKKTIKDQNTGETLKEINGTNENGDVLEEDITKDGVELQIRKVDEHNVPVAGIKFSGTITSEENNGGKITFTTKATDENGITTIIISKADIEQYIKLGRFNVVIDKEEWDNGAEAKWNAIAGNADRKLQFITSPVTISGYKLFETWDGNYAHRSVDFSGISCEDTEHVELEKDTVTIKFKNNDLTYNIPFIKTDKLLTNDNQDSAEKLKEVSFDISIKESDEDNNPQRFYTTSDDNGRFDIEGVSKFGDNVTLTLKEITSENETAQMLDEPIIITYKTVISNGKVSLENVKINGKEIDAPSDNQVNKTDIEEEKENNIQKIDVQQDEGIVLAGFNVVNFKKYRITIDKDLKVEDTTIDATESVGFKGIITTDPSKVNGNNTIMSYKDFENKLETWKNSSDKDVIYFVGHTTGGKLEIPKDIDFYDKQVYVYFIEYDVPATMTEINEVMWASFNKRITNAEANSASSAGNVEITNTDTLNISIKVVNQAKSYNVNFKKIDAQDPNRQIDYSNAKFTVQLKALKEDNSATEVVDTMDIEFNGSGKIKEQTKPGKYLVDAKFEDNQIKIDVNKFGNLQLVVTEDRAPANYQKLDTDIVINYKANAEASEKDKIITDVQLEKNTDSSIKDKINAKPNAKGNDVSLDFTLPNYPNEYSLTIKKKSRTNPDSILNNIQFQLLFYKNSDNKERFEYLEKTLYVVNGGKVTVDGLKEYGANYMVLHETETDGKVVKLPGYHVFNVEAVVGQKPKLTYLGMFKSDKEKEADYTIEEIDSKFKEQDISKLDKAYSSYFKTDENSVEVGSLVVGNDEPKLYDIDILKIAEEKDAKTGKSNPLEGAIFNLYLTKSDEDYATGENLLDVKYRRQTTPVDGLISIKQLDKYSDKYGDLKLTLVEEKPPKDYKTVFSKIEVTYNTTDGKTIEIKSIKVFDANNKEMSDYKKYVNITNGSTDKKIEESKIEISVLNPHKKSVPLGIKKVYYEETIENGQRTKKEKPISNATFSGVVYEIGNPDDKTPFTSKPTGEDGTVKLGDFYVEGEIEVVIEEISSPDGFEKIPKTTIECYVGEENKATKIDKKYEISTNAIESIEYTNNMNLLKVVDTPIFETDISLAGIVWEDRPTTLSEKEEADYTVVDGNKYVAGEGFYDEGIDKLITSKNADGDATSEVNDVVDGMIVTLHKLERNDKNEWREENEYTGFAKVTTGDTGRYEFRELDPFAKYYITFKMEGKYNSEDYEHVHFLVEKLNVSGEGDNKTVKIDDYNSIVEAKAANNLESWKRNSKAVADGVESGNGVDPNISTTTQTRNARGNKNGVNKMDNIQKYPVDDYFTIVDKEKYIDENGEYKGAYVLFNVDVTDSQKSNQTIVYADYSTSGKEEDKIEFSSLAPWHDYINYGIVEKPKFDLSLSKDVEELSVKVNDKTMKYIYGNKIDSGHMYTLEINEADISKLADMKIIYKIVVKNESVNPGYLNSIADYYNSDLMKFESWSLDGKNYGKTGVTETEETGLVPEQYITGVVDADGNSTGGTLTVNGANTKRVLIQIPDAEEGNKDKNRTIYSGDENAKTILITYQYDTNKLKENDSLFGKIAKAGDSYVTLGPAEIYSSNSLGGRRDINSINGNLSSKFTGIYNKQLKTFYTNYDNEGAYYQDLRHSLEGETDKDDEDVAPALKILIADPGNRKITGSVFDDIEGNGWKDENDINIKGIKVELYKCDENGNIREDAKPVQSTQTDEDGKYEFVGIETGYYKVKFTYGDENTLLPKLYTSTYNNDLLKYVQELQELPEWNDEENNTIYPRNNENSYNGLEYEDSTQNKIIEYNRGDEYWYKQNRDEAYSDAEDEDASRKKADTTLNESEYSTTTNYYFMDNAKAELLYSYRGDITQEEVQEYIRKLKENSVTATTEKFKINIMDTDSDELTYVTTTESGETQYTDGEHIIDTGCEAQIDFGVKQRPKTNLKVEKTVDNVKIFTSSGNSNVDASYKDGRAIGQVGRVQWSKDSIAGENGNGNRGYIWIQRSEEEIVGATLEITYNIKVKNEEDEATRKDQWVTIVDYVQEGMTYSDENNTGNGWNLQKATTKDNKSSIGNIYINKNIDLTNVSTVVTQDVELQNGESKDIKITLTKTLNSYSNTDIDAYTNYVEVILTATPDMAKSDKNSIPGNFDPSQETTLEGNLGTIYDLHQNRREIEEIPYDHPTEERTTMRLERDTAKALETISITAETGENRNTVYYILAFAIIAVFATGIGIIIKKVIKK